MENTTLFVLIAKRILRELEAMNSAIRTGIEGIQQKIGPVRAEEKSNQQNNAIHPIWLHPILAKHDKSEREKRTSEERQYRAQNSLRWATWLAFLAAAIYAGITAYQASLTRTAINDNRNSFKLLQRQTEALVRASIQRQFIVAWPTRQTYVSVILSNRGKTDATQVTANFTIDSGTFQGDKFMGSFLASWKVSVPIVHPDPEMPPTQGKFVDVSKESMFGRNQIGTTIRITGEITSLNGFESQKRSVCQYLMGPVTFTNKAGVMAAGIGEGPLECDQIESKLGYVKIQTDQYYK